jgi:hypothetical protein
MTAEHSAQIETERAGLAAMFLMMATARMFDLKSAACCAHVERRHPMAGCVASVVPIRHRPQSVAACLSIVAGRILSRMGTKSRETIYGASIRAAAGGAPADALPPPPV